METSTVTVKGQIVIPASIRRKIGLKTGTRVYIEEKEGNIVIHPATPEFYENSFGVLKNGGLVSLLERNRKADREKENVRIKKRS